MTVERLTLRRLRYAAAATVAVVLAIFFAIPRGGLAYDSWYTGFSLLPISGIVVGVWLRKPRSRLPWYLIAAGLAFNMAGDSVYIAYSAEGLEPPFPGIADVLYLPSYVFFGAGLFHLVRRRTPGRDVASLIDAAILTTGVGTVAWVFLMAPLADDPSLSMPAKLVSIAYPLMDMMLLAVAARILFSARLTHPVVRVMAFGLTLQLVGDTGYTVGSLQHWYTSGHIVDLTWLIAYLSWAFAALHPRMPELTERAAVEARPALGPWRLGFLTAATLLAPAMMALQAVRANHFSLLVTVGASVVLFGLVIARLASLVTRHENLVRRERALRKAAAALVGARNRTEVGSIAAAAAVSLTGRSARWSSVEIGPPASPTLVEVARADGVTDTDNQIAAERAADRDDPDTVRIPIEVVGWRAGTLTVRCARHPGRSVVEALEMLALQTAMALESMSLSEDLLEKQSSERFRALVQNSSDMIVVLDPDGAIRYQTPSVRSVLGYDEDVLVGTAIAELIHPDDTAIVANLLRSVAGRPSASTEAEVRFRRRDRQIRIADTVATNLVDDPNVGGIVLTAHDITDRKALEERLGYQAFHDPLTGLANRALFRDRVMHALERHVRTHEPPVVLFIDLDDFKSINDSLGHGTGDALLEAVARRLVTRRRAEDTVARLGGDEFAILLESGGLDGACQVATEIIGALSEPVDVNGTEMLTEASIGIAVATSGIAVDDLLRNADAAMYRAKHAGKARFEVFEQSMHAEATARLQLKTDLQRAMGADRFTLYYQPIVDLATNRVVSCEALLRWMHPERGIILPTEFVPLAEETGIIIPLGAWVLREACRQAATWLEDDPDGPGVSVNVSARQLQEGSIYGLIEDTLADTGLPPGKLTLEITESILIGRTQEMIERFGKLRRLGVKVAIDDFGTGYSSLSYLQGFPVDILKIAKQFIDDADVDNGRSRLLGAIIRLGITLNLAVVAEGVELEGQADQLRMFSSVQAQGFLFARPMDRDALDAWLTPEAVDAPAQHASAPL
jgi:diguanylate cyclase (GGDEF)-like protein/PAS domain S-box-containing protein